MDIFFFFANCFVFCESIGSDRVEAVLEATIQKLDAKTLYLKDREKLIQVAESQIHDLQSASYSDVVGLVL